MASLGLLDTAAEFCGTYLSELRRGTTRQQVIPYLLQIPDDRYPLDEWNDALAYLMGADDPCPSVAAVKDRLAASLCQPPRR
ncbi:hypothetical protein [Bittarella massiliensis (ex Durand et al. 2017)]|uniref:hypothetical protein n=1 Tax=Bittarella massiliensis (ex Durand et al. 2017) TaxID=1720313 RepID=UPI001AA18179|nr:hypothetical protein [Bittarella massiliensis (ex Durand et al. 2017)]MBO1678580.1 hypothetical protein [Bittarella massiliensis (ex Durand et al. 2017)]